MDSKSRLLSKAVTWQILGLLSMSVIGFVFTGSVRAGGGIAVAGCAVGFVCYFLHELAWARIPWGRNMSKPD
ncbi:DUF2061 domain-containing protein [Alphaproteobacteria bacterium KMM 3653]|uniref:DUF2061 domain-containing protein n=1 Tax=Harenicola maris TaxID=2841044 RepID=A0AAP2CP77_9RHOB|nr:DUF2061 domain-containing protein [Harenicola maris]